VRYLSKSRICRAVVSATVAMLSAGAANAGVATSWSTLSGSSFDVGSIISLSGNANATGLVGGTGLDLALVLDSSGSMAASEGGQSRNLWLKEASIALVNALPQGSTSVSVVDFDSSATTLRPLTPLSTGKGDVVDAINRLNASGGTNIPIGIQRAQLELTGPGATAGRVQMMVVVSDGESEGSPSGAAASALTFGVEAVHAVGIPGHSPLTMQGIAAAGNGVYTDGSNIANLVSIFNGTGGNLVGIDRVDVLMNDGTLRSNVAIDGLGNFTLSGVSVQAGANTFVATAYDSLGNRASATLNLVGSVTAVPEAELHVLMASGLMLLGVFARRRGRAQNRDQQA
jgi:Ca-activated chloride channel homolog